MKKRGGRSSVRPVCPVCPAQLFSEFSDDAFHGLSRRRSVRPGTVPGREAERRSISEAVGMDRRDADLCLRAYTAAPGEQIPMTDHYHDEQVEAFYVTEGRLRVETPDEEFVVPEEQVSVVKPGDPHRAFNPTDADARVRVLAVGAPSVEDRHVYEPRDGA